MEVIEIYKPYLYSVQYDNEDENEFDRLFQQWNDLEFVTRFMMENIDYLSDSKWGKTFEPEDASRQVLNEAEGLENLFYELCENVEDNKTPDLDSHFKFLEGKYKYEIVHPPMKSYGIERPSLLRLYAIKLDSNTYLITGGGIKLGDTIQNSPDLKDHVLQNIDKVKTWLKQNGITDSNDL